MKNYEHRKLRINTRRLSENDWAIFVNGRPALIGLSEKDVKLFQQKTEEEVIAILSLNRNRSPYSPEV